MWEEPPSLVWAASLVPAAELVLAFLLATGVALQPVWLATLSLLGAYTILGGLHLAMGLRPECGCFFRGERFTFLSLLRNLALLAVALLGLMEQRCAGKTGASARNGELRGVRPGPRRSSGAEP
ncbi:MAG: MauE/DoxX family redox-associated membrane protein, partial [Bacillota bacterium]